MHRATMVVHIALWLALTANALWLGWENYVPNYGVGYWLVKTMSVQVLYLTIFYSNYGFLIPRFFDRRIWWAYGLGVLGVILLSILWQWGFFVALTHWQGGELVSFKFHYGLYFSINGLTYMVLSGLAWYTWRSLVLSKKAQQLEEQKVRAELNALVAKVNPHFLFNTLNNIYVLVRNRHPHAAQSVLELSGLMRYMTEQTEKAMVPLDKEVAMLSDYLSLQHIRLEPDFNINVELPVSIDTECMIPPLLFIPLAENIFKHGDLSTEGFVEIKLEVVEHRVKWYAANRIGNDGEGAGTGLSTLKERLKLQYGEDCRLEIERAKDIFETRLSIPV